MRRKVPFNARSTCLVAVALALLVPRIVLADPSGFETATTTFVAPPGADFRAPVKTPPVEASKPLAALGDSITVLASGLNTGIIRLPPGSWTGTLVADGSADGTFTDVVTLNVLTYGPGAASQATMTAPGTYEVTITGLAAFRLRVTSAITSGPVSALVRAAVGNKSIRVGAPSGNPVPVATPSPATVVTGQIKIVTTGTPVALPSNSLVNGVVVKAKSTNQAQAGTYSGMVGAAGVTTAYNGTGAGYPLAPGEAASFAVSNSNLIYVNGTAGDVFSYEGN